MAKKLFVANLKYDTSEAEMREFFEAGGFEVDSAQIVMDRETGKSKGFGFVELANESDIDEAIASLNDKRLGGRAIVVKIANPPRPREDRYAKSR